MGSDYRYTYNDSWHMHDYSDYNQETYVYSENIQAEHTDVSKNKIRSQMVEVLRTASKLLAWHRITPIRKRYMLTRRNRLRLRYAVLIPAILIAGSIKLTNYEGSFLAFDMNNISSWSMLNEATARETDSTYETAQGNGPETIQSQIASGVSQAAAILTSPPPFKNKRILTLQSGQTLAGLIQKEGVSGSESYLAIKALSKYMDPRKAKAGQKVTLQVKQTKDKDSDKKLLLKELVYDIDPIQYIKVTEKDGSFNAAEIKRKVSSKSHAGQATIQTSVFGSASKYGIPSAITAELIRIYSWDVDFQRDIRQGDKLEVLYETQETEEGTVAEYGNILYANLSVGGHEIPIYRFKMKNGDIDYFTEDGWSIKKTLMKTPVDGARISSGFGMRKHPILGYSKMHKGMDFAAPTGTPIYAAGDGTIEYAARNGGYGNYIRIRHNSQLKTAYAHMHRFAKGMSKGKRVKQGEVIGYIGTTGRSTGPHLHYEVLKNNVQVNPNRVDLPTGEKLKGTNMANFKNRMKKLKAQYKEQLGNTTLVQNENDNKTQIH